MNLMIFRSDTQQMEMIQCGSLMSTQNHLHEQKIKKQKIKALVPWQTSDEKAEVFEAEYLSEEGLNSAEGIEENYIAATDNETSGDSEGIANALDGNMYKTV